MIDHGKKNLLGIDVDAIDYQAAVAKIMKAAKEQRRFTVSALAVHGVMTGVLDSEHGYRLNRFDLLVPDGQPVRWALNFLYQTGLSDRVYGPTLTLKVCEEASKEGLPIYLYGSRLEVLEQLAHNLTSQFPGLQIAGYQPSRFRQLSLEEKQEVVQTIRQSGAALVLVGLGCPRQEIWIYEHREHLSMPMLAVGAAFDFHAGTLAQAPTLLQDAGLEWFYRLCAEPKRLWKRYIYLNPLYLYFLFLQFMHIRKFTPELEMRPSHELRYG